MTENLNGLIEFIYRAENRGRVDYDVVYGGIRPEHRPPKPITQMTVGEVLSWQSSIDRLYNSEAAGAGQFMEDTLRDQVRKGVVSPDDLFDATTQDKLTVSLLRRRGLDKWQAGEITTEQFGTNLAKEWASLPVLQATYDAKGRPIQPGQAYYGGVGANRSRAHASVNEFAAVLGAPSADTISSQNSGMARDPNAPPVKNAYDGDTWGRMWDQTAQPQLDPTVHMEPWKQPDYEPGRRGTDNEGSDDDTDPFEGLVGPDLPDPDYKTRTGPGGGPLIHPGWGQAFSDEVSDSFIVRGMQYEFEERGYEWDKTFDPVSKALDEGLGDHWRYFADARNPAHYEQLKANLAAEQKRKRRQAVNPYLSADLIGGLVNPDTIATMILPGGVGVSAMRSGMANAARTFGKAGLIAGASEAAIESGRRQFDPMATYEESLMRVGGTALLGGVLGGGIGAMATRSARRNLVRGVMNDIAIEKGIFEITEEVDLGGGVKGRVRVGSLPENASPAARRAGVVVADGEVIVDDAILHQRFMKGDHNTDARTPNELLEYEVARASSLARKTQEGLRRFVKSEDGSVGPDNGASLYRVTDEGTVEVDEPRVRSLYDRGEPLRVGPAEGAPSKVKPVDIDSRAIQNADEAVRIVREAAQAAAKARDQVEFENNLKGILRASGDNFQKKLTPEEQAARVELERQAEIEAAEALENYRAKNNKILQDTKLEALARLTDGPYKRIHRNGLTAEVRDLVDKLAADGAFLRGSDATGLTVGPSVYSRARTWDGIVDTLYRQETAAYEKYLGFKTNQEVAGIAVNKSVDAVRRKRADGTPSIGIKEFRRRATTALISGKADPIPEVNEMASAIKRGYEEYRMVAERYGVLRSAEMLDQRIANVEEEIADAVDNLETVPQWKHDLLDDLKAQKAKADQEPNEDYFTRVFDHAAIRDNRKEFKERIVKPWMRQQPYGQYWKAGKDELEPHLREVEKYGTEAQKERMRRRYNEAPDKSDWVTEKFDTSPDAIDARAEKLIDTILEEAEPGDLATLRDPRRPTFGRSRQFNIPNSMLLKDGPNGNGMMDFIETDYMLVHKVYAERMGPAIEMARSFARPVDGVDAWRGFDEAVDSARQRELVAWENKAGADPKAAEKVEAAREDARAAKRREIEQAPDKFEQVKKTYDDAKRAWARAKENADLARMTPEQQREWLDKVEERAQTAWNAKGEDASDEITYFAKMRGYIRAAQKNAEEQINRVRQSPAWVKQSLDDASKRLNKAGNDYDDTLRLVNLSESEAESVIEQAGRDVRVSDVIDGFEDHWAPIQRDLIHLRDRVTNRVVRAPDRWDNRTATNLRNWSHLTFMGMSALSTIPEIGMLIARHGVGRVWQGTLGTLDDATRAALKANVDEMRKAGAILDIVQGSALSHFAETGVDAIHGTRLERWLRTGANRYFMWNGLAPITARLKEIDAGIRVHDMVERIDRVAMLGKGADKSDLQELARWGISRADAERMAQEPIIQTDEGHWLANTDAWGDEELVRKFRAAIAQGNENTILMATAADKSTIVDGAIFIRKGGRADKYAVRAGLESEGDYWRIQSGLMSLPFTFWSYGLAATNKIMIAGLDEPSARKLGGIAAMVGLGYMVSSVKTPDYIWDRKDPGEKILDAIDQSGIMGVLSNAKGIAQQDGFGDTAMRIAGAGPTAAGNLIGGAVTGDANTFSKGLPLQNHIILGDLFDAAVDGIERRKAGLD